MQVYGYVIFINVGLDEDRDLSKGDKGGPIGLNVHTMASANLIWDYDVLNGGLCLSDSMMGEC